MPRIFNRVPTSFAFCAFLAALAAGGGVAAAETHGPHVHGAGVLNLAVEGDAAHLELVAPGADIVGFEHAPASEAETAAIAAAIESLEAGAALFRFPDAAGCALAAADVDAPHALGEHAGGDQNHSKDGDHAHAKDGDRPRAEGHSEFRAVYRFSCSNAAAIDGVETTYFERFAGAEELEVRALLPGGQAAGELSRAEPRLQF